MLKMKKKATTTLFVLATSCFAAGFAMLGFQATDVAKADGATEDIYMKASASVRVDDPIGIRFSTYVSEEYASSGKSFGTFIIPETAYAGDIEDIDQNTPNVLDIPQVVWADSDLDGYKKYTAVLIGIPESFYGVDIYAMSYAKDGENYEFVSNPQSYSVAYIASAALNNGESAEALYTYTNAVAEGVTVDTASATLWEGEELALTATTQPAGYKAVWTSSDKSVATVDKYGVVTGVSEGTATITATFGNYTASCEISVWPYTVSFEKGIPAGFTGTLRNTKVTQSNAQASDGEYSMLLDTTSSNGYGYTCISKEYLDKVFADENVVAIAIDVYSNATFTDFAYRGFRPSGEANISYGKAGLTANTWKTIYYGRTAYEESANLTGTNYLFYYSPDMEGFDMYVDNMRPVMADELGINFNENGEVNGEVYSVNGETVVTISGGVTNMKLYEGKSSDGDNKSIRYQFWRGNPGSDIILPIEQMLLGAGAYSYVAFDVMVSYDVSGALYYTNNTGTGTYDDIKANEWTTIYCPINYYNLTMMDRTYVFRLPAYKLDNFLVYVDNIRFVNEKPTTYTITYDANGGSVDNDATVVMAGAAYTLETPTAPDAFATFEGWYLNGEKFPATGTWMKEENITLTAQWSYDVSFENGIPAGFTGTLRNTKVTQSNAQASDGEYSMLLDTTSSNGYGYTCINQEYLDKVFADENVVAIAIDVYSNATFTDFAYRGFRPSGEANISYGKAGLTANTWKTIYYGRTAYEESANLTGANYLFYYAPDMEGFDMYVDNFRPVMADELGINFNEGGEVVNNESYQINGETVVTISGGVNNLMVYEGKSSDGDNKSIRYQFWRRNAGGDIILPIEQMLLGAGAYSYVAFDVMVSYDVSGAIYYTNSSGTGTYDDIKANEWTTLYCPINYYDLTMMDRTYVFRLPASTADNFMVYVDNIRFVDEKSAPAPQTVSFEDGNYEGAIDVYSVTAFTDFCYKGIDAAGNIDKNIEYDSEGLIAGEWKTVYFTREAYENMASLTGTIFHLYFNGGAGTELYVDNFRAVY